jgi:hypothetical protein
MSVLIARCAACPLPTPARAAQLLECYTSYSTATALANTGAEQLSVRCSEVHEEDGDTCPGEDAWACLEDMHHDYTLDRFTEITWRSLAVSVIRHTCRL